MAGNSHGDRDLSLPPRFLDREQRDNSVELLIRDAGKTEKSSPEVVHLAEEYFYTGLANGWCVFAWLKPKRIRFDS